MLSFAIVIPNLNQSRFLHTALRSLYHQNTPINLAIMDGGSNDEFEDVVNRYSDIISYVRSKPDDGQSSAIDEVINNLPDDIFTWLNADDYYFPNALDKVRDIFEKNPQVDVVYGDAVHVTADGFFRSYFPPIKAFNKSDLTYDCFICQPACFYRRSLYNKVGGLNTKLEYTMDWDLWCRFAEADATFYYLQEPLAAVRYYPGTKTLRVAKERFKEIYRIEKKYGDRILRRSVVGAYYNSLKHKENRTVGENIFLNFFDLLRKSKRKIVDQSLLYGFHRWDPIFEKACCIHLPWYEDQHWTKLRLKMEPIESHFQIKLNQVELDPVRDPNGDITAALPDIDTPHRTIQIECQDGNRCKLLNFACDLK